MTKERKMLLIILGVVAFGCVLALGLIVGLGALGSAKTQLSLLKAQYERLSRQGVAPEIDLATKVRALQAAIDARSARFYAKGETDPYRFGSEITELLARHGITVEQFRTTSGESGPLIDFTTSGSAEGVVDFLADLSRAPKYLTVPYLHIQSTAGTGRVAAEIQIGYLER